MRDDLFKRYLDAIQNGQKHLTEAQRARLGIVLGLKPEAKKEQHVTSASIKKFDRNICKMLRPELEKTLIPLEKQFKIKANIGRATYMQNNATFKVELAVIDGKTGDAITEEAEAFRICARRYGFDPDDLGKEFYCAGRKFKITGLRTKATKRPIVCTDDKGKNFIFDATTVLMSLKKTA